jgi:hypothetical protein
MTDETDDATGPSIGLTDECQVCGGLLKYEGRFWEHVDSSVRHQPAPKTFAKGRSPLADL